MNAYTNEQIVTAAREAVAEKGVEYVYQKGGGELSACYYATPDMKPSCIVGHILAKIAPEAFEDVAAHERKPDPDYNGTGIKRVADELNLGFTPDQVYRLNQAQIQQDRGDTWGEALRAIEKLEVA